MISGDVGATSHIGVVAGSIACLDGTGVLLPTRVVRLDPATPLHCFFDGTESLGFVHVASAVASIATKSSTTAAACVGPAHTTASKSIASSHPPDRRSNVKPVFNPLALSCLTKRTTSGVPRCLITRMLEAGLSRSYHVGDCKTVY